MNSLSLRVSSIKNSDNLKKNSEIRVALLGLPPKYTNINIQNGMFYTYKYMLLVKYEYLYHFLLNNKEVGDVADFDLSKFKIEFAGASSIDQQLVTVRKV